jgi:hypothetical protein
MNQILSKQHPDVSDQISQSHNVAKLTHKINHYRHT